MTPRLYLSLLGPAVAVDGEPREPGCQRAAWGRVGRIGGRRVGVPLLP